MTNDPTTGDRPVPRRRLIVALDGPGSSGKSTVGAEAARRLRYRFCDTGLLYRAVTWLALERGVAPESIESLVTLASEVRLIADGRGRLRHVEVDGRDVTVEVRGEAVDREVSAYSKVAELRAALVSRQRAIAAAGGIIMAGRDIGTVILPDADLKLYLNASAEERARRRVMQRRLVENGPEAHRILAELRARDAIDSGRQVAPLRIPDDAVVIRTDGNTFNETVSEVVRAVRRAEDAAAGPQAGSTQPAVAGRE